MRVVENTDLSKPVLNKIMATWKQCIKQNFVATLNVIFHGVLWIITYSQWADTVFLAVFWGQNITWVFSNLRVFTFYKSMMGCLNWYLLLKIEEFYRPEWIKRGTTWKWILTIFKYKNEYYKQSRKSRWKKWGHLSSF